MGLMCYSKFCFLQDGVTPLLRAVRSRNEECVKLLLNKGAKVSAFDKVTWFFALYFKVLLLIKTKEVQFFCFFLGGGCVCLIFVCSI